MGPEARRTSKYRSGNHPDVVSGRRFRSANQWPEGLPGFREPLVAYCDALERLVRHLVRVYARAPRRAPAVGSVKGTLCRGVAQ